MTVPLALPVGGGLLLIDKPTGNTSHDVVGRVRRILGTRRVGHAGTLDPMATGLLVLAVDRSTKLLGHLALTDKSYLATIRLGQATVTDDAEGELLPPPAGGRSPGGLTSAEIGAVIGSLTGDIRQVPSAVSAIKIDGQRSYARVRAGEQVELAARPVTVSRFERLGDLRRHEGFVDLDVVVDCSSGTYVRALARDLGSALRVGGHLTRLRRTRVGPFEITSAIDLPDGPSRPTLVDPVLAARVVAAVIPAAEVVRLAFPTRDVDDVTAADLRFGRPIPADGTPGTYGVFCADLLLALVSESAGWARPRLVWSPAG